MFYRIRFLYVMLYSLFSKNKNLTDDFKLSFWAIPFSTRMFPYYSLKPTHNTWAWRDGIYYSIQNLE